MVTELLQSFERRHLTLLRDAVVEDSGQVRVDTSAGAHVTSSAVLEALLKREQDIGQKKTKAREKKRATAYKKPKADIELLLQLAPKPKIVQERLAQCVSARWECRWLRARLLGTDKRMVALQRVVGQVMLDSDEEEIRTSNI